MRDDDENDDGDDDDVTKWESVVMIKGGNMTQSRGVGKLKE